MEKGWRVELSTHCISPDETSSSVSFALKSETSAAMRTHSWYLAMAEARFSW